MQQVDHARANLCLPLTHRSISTDDLVSLTTFLSYCLFSLSLERYLSRSLILYGVKREKEPHLLSLHVLIECKLAPLLLRQEVHLAPINESRGGERRVVRLTLQTRYRGTELLCFSVCAHRIGFRASSVEQDGVAHFVLRKDLRHLRSLVFHQVVYAGILFRVKSAVLHFLDLECDGNIWIIALTHLPCIVTRSLEISERESSY